MTNTTYKLETGHLQPLTAKQQEEIRHLYNQEVDTSDIAELDETFFQNAVRNPFYKVKKSSTTIRLDNDVLMWLKSRGKGYQTRINQILREAMLQSLQAK